MFLVRYLRENKSSGIDTTNLSPGDFKLKTHSELFSVTTAVHPIDLITVSTELQKRDRIDLLTHLVTFITGAVNQNGRPLAMSKKAIITFT